MQEKAIRSGELRNGDEWRDHGAMTHFGKQKRLKKSGTAQDILDTQEEHDSSSSSAPSENSTGSVKTRSDGCVLKTEPKCPEAVSSH